MQKKKLNIKKVNTDDEAQTVQLNQEYPYEYEYLCSECHKVIDTKKSRRLSTVSETTGDCPNCGKDVKIIIKTKVIPTEPKYSKDKPYNPLKEK